MVCFCKNTMAQLRLTLPQLNVSADVDLDASVAVAVHMQLIARWLAQFGLPAAPWQPDAAWLDLELPTVALSANAMATISAFAQLRASVLAQFGIDLLIPGQAAGFARLAVTLQARLQAALEVGIGVGVDLGLSFDAGAWARLAATLQATAQVQAALELGLFPAPPPGPPLALWRPFLIRLRALLPLIAVSAQLGIDLSADISVQLAAALRVMLRIQLPAFPLPALTVMASLTTALSAVAQLRVSLGIDPLVVGLPAVRLMVAERIRLTATAAQSALGMDLAALLNLLNLLPRLEFSASLMATPAVVAAALRINAQALARVDWQVPLVADLPVLSLGLPVVAFTAQLQAALGLTATVRPCGAVCDAAALTRPAAGVGATAVL